MSDETSQEKTDKRRGPRTPKPQTLVPTGEAAPDLNPAPQTLTTEPVVPALVDVGAGDVNNMSSTDDVANMPVVQNADPNQPNVVVIHFVDEGLTALGKSFYRGEELAIEEGSGLWNETLDNGRSWLTYDEDEQVARWGKRHFRAGPWRGLGYDAAEFPVDENGNVVGLTAPELAELERLRQQQSLASRMGAVPAVSHQAQAVTMSGRPSSRTAGPPILPSSR